MVIEASPPRTREAWPLKPATPLPIPNRMVEDTSAPPLPIPNAPPLETPQQANSDLKSLFTDGHVCVMLAAFVGFVVRFMAGAFVEGSTSGARNLTSNATAPTVVNSNQCNTYEGVFDLIILAFSIMVYAVIRWKRRGADKLSKGMVVKKSLLFFVYLATTHSQPISCLLDKSGNAFLSYIQGSLLIVIAVAALLSHYPTGKNVTSSHGTSAKGYQVNHTDAFIVALYHAIVKFTQPTVHAECSDARTALALTAFVALSAAAKLSLYICLERSGTSGGVLCGVNIKLVKDVSKKAFILNVVRTLGIMAYLLSSHSHPLSCLLGAKEFSDLSFAQSGIAGSISVSAFIAHAAC